MAVSQPGIRGSTGSGHLADLRALIEAIPQPAWVADAEGRPREFNAAWYGYTRLSPEQSLNFGWHALVHPEDLHSWIFVWADSVKKGEAFEAEFRLRRFSDHAYRWLCSRCIPIKSGDGRPAQWVGICNDVHDRKLAADELHHARDLFHFFAKEVHDQAVMNLDPEGIVIGWNTGAERMTGYAASEILGKHYGVFYTREDIAQGKPGKELKQASLMTRLSDECSVVRKDGSMFYARITTTSLRSRTGEIRSFARVIHDLTRVKGAEAGLQLYMELWENLPIGLVLLHDEEAAKDRDFTILAANRAVLQIIRKEGIEVEDILNLRFFEVFSNLLEKEVADSLRHVTKAGTTMSLGEVRLREAPQGEAVFSIRAFPLPNRCLGLVFEDITEQAEAKEALRRNEARFRAILESAPDAMVVTDRDGRMVVVNRQTELLFGYRREEMIGEPVEMLMPARFRTGHVAKRAHYAAHAQTRPMGSGMQLYGRRKDGTEFPANISLSPMETDAGFWLCSAVRESQSESQNPIPQSRHEAIPNLEKEMTETGEVKKVRRVKRVKKGSGIEEG